MKIVCTIKSIEPVGDGKAIATITLNPVWGEGQFTTLIQENIYVKGGITHSIDGETVQEGQGLLVDISKWKNPNTTT